MKHIIFILFSIFFIGCFIFGFLHNRAMMMICAFMMSGAIVTEILASRHDGLTEEECYELLYGGMR